MKSFLQHRTAALRTTRSAPAMSGRSQSLDVLRGVAVIMVIVDHYAVVIGSKNPLFDSLGRGVDLFFVLSGFLISGLLFSEYKMNGRLNLSRFWIRRGFKIYPAFYLFLLSTWVFAKMPLRVFANEALFLQGYTAHFWFHTWSLAVEEHFYLALPLLLILLSVVFKKSPNPFRMVPLLSIGVSCLCLYLRLLAARSGGQIGIPSHLRIDALLAGVALGYFWHFDRASFESAKSVWVLMTGLICSFVLLFMPVFLQLTFAYIAFSFIVAWAVSQPKKDYPATKALARIGRHSYSIYLWHAWLAMWLASRLGPSSGLYRFPLYAAAAVLFGIVMSKAIEFPVLTLRDRLFPSVLHQAVTMPIEAEINFTPLENHKPGDGVSPTKVEAGA